MDINLHTKRINKDTCEIEVSIKKHCTGINISNNYENKNEQSRNVNISSSSLLTEDSKFPLILSAKLSESDVGITEHVNKIRGFSAVMKERYSDFLVNEIDLEGKILRLTNFDLPFEPDTKVDWKILTEEELNLLKELKQNLQQQVYINVSNRDKDDRRKIHELIRKEFKDFLSKTETHKEEKYIIIEKNNPSNKNARSERKGRRFHPHDRENFTHFLLYKENRDTMDAINRIAMKLKLPPKLFSYAGTKDKRGKTVQAVSAYRVAAEDLLSVNSFQQLKVGNIKYKATNLKLGDLSGNHFVLILRQLEGDVNQLDKVLDSFSTRGFLNYYGMQRFGTQSVATYQIGRALILGQWKDAINLILKQKIFNDNEKTDQSLKQINEACKTWITTGNVKLAVKKLIMKSAKWSIEGRLLFGLHNAGENNYVGALNAIPRNTRLMYIHSYQSYIWNKVLSKRIKEYGLKPHVGDLVTSQPVEVLERRQDGEDHFDLCEEQKLSSHAMDDLVKNINQEHSQTMNEKVNVEILTLDHCEKTEIYDVVLPLPGHSVQYPDNQTKIWYEEFLSEDGLNLSSFTSNVKAYSLSGAYRKIIVKPQNLKYEILSYKDKLRPLVLSDYDVMLGKELLSPLPLSEENVHKALKLQFSLPSSSYATMAVREVLDQCFF